MAEDILNINGADTGWDTLTVTDIDEAVADADGSTATTGTENDVVLLDLSATAVVDADTVTAVDITARIAEGVGSAGNNRIGIEFLIGSVVQGVRQDSANMTTTLTDVTFSDANWDADWTAAQLAGAQVQCYAIQQGKGETATWVLDCLDVTITYTAAGGGASVPVKATRTYRNFRVNM